MTPFIHPFSIIFGGFPIFLSFFFQALSSLGGFPSVSCEIEAIFEIFGQRPFLLSDVMRLKLGNFRYQFSTPSSRCDLLFIQFLTVGGAGANPS